MLSCQTFPLVSIGFYSVAVLLNNISGWGVTSLTKDIHNTNSSSSSSSSAPSSYSERANEAEFLKFIFERPLYPKSIAFIFQILVKSEL
jgi:hypothetical protein